MSQIDLQLKSYIVFKVLAIAHKNTLYIALLDTEYSKLDGKFGQVFIANC